MRGRNKIFEKSDRELGPGRDSTDFLMICAQRNGNDLKKQLLGEPYLKV